MFPEDGGEEVVLLFDTAFDYSAGKDQKKLNGLAMLLTCLEDGTESDFGENNQLSIPLLCKMQALQAAYKLGRATGPGLDGS